MAPPTAVTNIPTLYSFAPASSDRDWILVRFLMRVNSTNVLDEGLRIREVGRWMNSKVKRQTRCVSKVNVVISLAYFQSVPYRPLLAPIYRWPGLKDRERSDTNYNIGIRHELVFRLGLHLVLA
jgi:hypothetical protein